MTDKTKDSASQEFNNFDQQLVQMEALLHSTSEYNDKLTIYLDSLQKLAKQNECVVTLLQSNGHRIDSLLKGTSKQKLAVQCGNHSQRKLSSPVFKDPRTQCHRKDPANYSLCSTSQQLTDLGAKVHAIGKEVQMLRNTARENKDASPHRSVCAVANKRQICCTPHNHSKRAESQSKGLTELERETQAVFYALQKLGQNEVVFKSAMTLPNFDNHQQLLIDRVRNILTSAERLNLNSVMVTNVKVLCQMVLQALYKRTDVYQMFSSNNPYV